LEELQDEAFPPGLDFECEPSIASHDPLDDDLVPECPPPDVFPEDVPDEDEDPVHGLHQVWQLLQVLRAMQLQCCLRIMFKNCFRNLYKSGVVSSVALAPQRLQSRRIRSMVKVSKIVLAKMSYLSSLVPKIPISERLDMIRAWRESHSLVQGGH